MPVLRKSLELIPRVESGEGFRYIIKDHFSGKVYEFGEEEFFICQNLDGKKSFSFIKESFENYFGFHLKESHVEAFCRQLDCLGLLETRRARLDESDTFEQTVLLGNFPRLINFLYFIFGWCFSRMFVLSSFFLFILGIGVSVKYGEIIFDEFRLLGPGLKISGILAVFLLCNFLGEIVKAIALRHYSRDAATFYLKIRYRVIPYFFVDIGTPELILDSFVMIRVFLSSIVTPLLLFSISIILWKNTVFVSGINIFCMIVAVASFIYFLLNINPFFERDGYLLFCVWVKIQNLSKRAAAYVKSRVLFKPVTEPLDFKEEKILKIYGVMWFCFQCVYWCLILFITGFVLMNLFEGVGLCFFLCLVFCRFENSIRRLFMKVPFWKKDIVSESGKIKWRLFLKLSILFVIIIIMFFPYPYEVGGEFRLLPIRQEGVRAKISSEINRVLVKEGDLVKKGQVLAMLLGRDQKKRFEEVKALLDEAKAKLDLVKKGAKPEEIAKAEQEVKAAEKSLEYSTIEADRAKKMFKDRAISDQVYDRALRLLDGDSQRLEIAKKNLELVKSGFREEQVKMAEAEVRRLQVQFWHAEEDLKLTTLTSPIDGHVITPNLEEKVGQFLAEGELFAVVEDASKVIAEIELPEKYIGEVSIDSGVKLRSWAYPGTVFKGKVRYIAPVAYEKSTRRIERALSGRELLFEQKEILRKEGKVVRVLSELSNEDRLLKTDTTGYAKIECRTRPVIVAFSNWFVRFILVEVWSWIP